MNAWMEVDRITAEMQRLRLQLQRLREERAGWETVARTGDEEVSETEADRLGLVRKIQKSLAILEDRTW
jgi:hypothetical protein